MWLKKAFWFLLLSAKYLIFGLILTVIISYFFPVAGIIVGLVFLLGSFSAAYNDLKDKVIPGLEYRVIQKQHKKLLKEFEGFDEMTRITQRNI